MPSNQISYVDDAGATVTVDFDAIAETSSPPPLAPMAQMVEREGVDGYEVVRTGTRSRRFRWGRCVKFTADKAAAEAFRATVEAAAGRDPASTVLYDADGTAISNVLLVLSEPVEVRPVIESGAARYRVVAALDGQLVT